MFLVACLDRGVCGFVFGVIGDPPEIAYAVGECSSFWPDQYACPKCGGKARGGVGGYGLQPRVFLEVQEAFAALEGLGLPEDEPCDQETVDRVLTGAMIKHVRTSLVPNSDRVYIEWLELVDGRRIYFCATGHGAAIYRIVLPRTRHVEPP